MYYVFLMFKEIKCPYVFLDFAIKTTQLMCHLALHPPALLASPPGICLRQSRWRTGESVAGRHYPPSKEFNRRIQGVPSKFELLIVLGRDIQSDSGAG
jgi:hypothetical protein